MIRKPVETIHSGYSQNCKDAVVSAATGQQLLLYSARAHNRSGGPIDVALLKKFSSSALELFLWDAAGTVTEVTDTILAGTAVDLIHTHTNDGYVVQADRRFNVVGFTISQAQAGSPVFEYNYWNGSGWATLTTIAVPSTYATGTQLVVFPSPIEWAPGGSAAGLLSAYYSIRVRATTLTSTAVRATAIWVGQFLEFSEAVADNGALSINFPDERPLVLQAEEGLLPYFGGTATAANSVSSVYSTLA